MTTERVEPTKDAGIQHQPPIADLHDEQVEDVRFTNEGQLPDVLDDDMDWDGPSASERAYGDVLRVGERAAVPQQARAKPKTFKTLKGTDVERTKGPEATILRELRQSHLRIDPAWLLKAQTDVLQVGDATGAMNTETLRAIHTRAGRAVGAAEILSDVFLNSILNTGTSPLAVTGTGLETETANAESTRIADKAVQAVGYADYESYKQELGTTPITFLGRSMKQGTSNGLAHPYLTERLALAENFLRSLFAGKVAEAKAKGTKLTDDQLVARFAGWNGSGGAGYDTDDSDIKAGKAHQHTMGLAIDIDAGANGWIWDEHENSHPEMDKHLGLSSQLFGGEAFTAGKLDRLSDNVSTEELHAEVSTASGSFGKYLSFVKEWKVKYDADQKTTTTALIAELQTRGITDADEKMVKNMMWFAGWFNQAKYRKGMTQLTNIQMPMLVALRDVAGLSWGGTEMSSNENGDFMHFDCRDTSLGKTITGAARQARIDAAEAARKEAALKAAAKKKK